MFYDTQKKNTNFLKKTTFRIKETFILIRTINQLTNGRQMIYSDIFSYIFSLLINSK